MTLADIIKAAETGFSSVSTDSKREGTEISSGGNDVPGDANVRTEPAALYATEELALEAWFETFDRFKGQRWIEIGDGQPAHEVLALVWVEKPYIETYRITLGDQHNSYRIVRDRYVARGRVAVEAFVDDGIALTNAVHPEGPAVAEDADISPNSIVTVEMDEEQLKPSGKHLKIKRKAKAA